MKNLLEDVASKNIRAMYFSTTYELKVGDPHIRSGFWGKVMNLANEKKFQS